jgi:uncharacterized protein (DUF1800 family)
MLERRAFLRTAAVGAAAVGAAIGPFSGVATATSAQGHLTSDQDLHLLRRATFGPNQASLARIRKIGRDRWLDEQLKPAGINDGACDGLIDRLPELRISMRDKYESQDFDWDVMFALSKATVIRAAWSERQLFEVMVDFWSNHLNVANPGDHGWYNRHDYDRTVIRKHAFGRFEDMLMASAKHPAMLHYLNNAESTKDDPNENYGRELLELHTVGIDGGYTEEHMRNSALIMTGWGIDWDTGLYRYDGSNHYQGHVEVLGFSRANSSGPKGEALARDYLRYLARHRKTAEYICMKLARRFVGDDPPQGLVESLADTYQANGTAIVPVLRKLFRSDAFRSSIGDKVRRPYEDLIATLRALRIKADAHGTDGVQALYWIAEGLGQAPLAWSPPNGYPDTADAWRSAGGTLERWNIHMSLAAHWWPDQIRRPAFASYFPKHLPATYGDFVQDVAKEILFVKIPGEQRDAICGFFDKAAGSPLHDDDAILNWRQSHLLALLLDTPTHLLR